MRRLNLTLGLLLVGLLTATALLAPLLSPHDPQAYHLENKFEKPSVEYWFGNDPEGRDVFSRILYGGRVSLSIAVTVVTISLSIGLLLGLIAGWHGGLFDVVFLFISDLFLAFPGFLLAIAMAAFLSPSMWNVIFVLSLVGWVSFARLVRGQVLTLKDRDYVLSARVVGVHFPRLMLRYLVPNILGPLMVQATFALAGVILVESTLSFLGLGVPPTTPSWGAMLDQGTQYLLIAPHLSIFPGIFIMAVVLGFNFLGDGLRDKLDPKQEAHEEV